MRMRLPAAEILDTGIGTGAPAPQTRVAGVGDPTMGGRDPKIGQIFRSMRAATRLSREVLARHLTTTPATIDDLENGALSSLPHWRETARIVRSYCELLRLDPQPILWHLQNCLEAANPAPVEPSLNTTRTRPPGPPPPVLSREHPAAPRLGRGRRRVRTMFALSAPVVGAAAALYIAQALPAPVYRAINLLPRPLAGPARAGMDRLVLYSAPRRDGLRWVDVGDPQLRKVDRLPANDP